MICAPCRQAGENNAAGNYSLSEFLHTACESHNCPCQHKTGKYINMEATSK